MNIYDKTTMNQATHKLKEQQMLNDDKTITNQNQLTTRASPTALSAALNSYAANVDGAVHGLRLKFVKGEWFIGENPVQPGDGYRAELPSITQTWERWEDKRIVDRHVAALDERLPPRSSLGDLDDTNWERGLDARPRDPWTETHYLGLIRVRDNEPLAYAASSDGGRKAIAVLAREGAKRPGMLPIVSLGSSSYTHRHFGKVLKPAFHILSWVPEDGEGGLNGSALLAGPDRPDDPEPGYDEADFYLDDRFKRIS